MATLVKLLTMDAMTTVSNMNDLNMTNHYTNSNPGRDASTVSDVSHEAVWPTIRAFASLIADVAMLAAFFAILLVGCFAFD